MADRLTYWCAPETAKRVDRAVKKLGLSSREAFVLRALEKV